MMKAAEKKRLVSFLSKFSQCSILVVGDIMLDEYIEGVVDRVSPEAPIPVVNLFHKRQDQRLGGAANVFHNLVSLGSKKVFLCGVVGDDTAGEHIVSMLKFLDADTEGIVIEKGRPTTVKTRIIAHNQQVIRLDREEKSPISRQSRQKMEHYIKGKLDKVDAVIFSDYEKGVITESLLKDALPSIIKKRILVAVDPKFSNFKHFKKVTVIVPNRKEASGFIRHELETQQDVFLTAKYIIEKLQCECVLIKMGEQGMTFVDREGGQIIIKTAAEQVYDVTGAGDTVISTLVLARTAGSTWEEAAKIANFAAGTVIHCLGTSPANPVYVKNAILKNKFPKL